MTETILVRAATLADGTSTDILVRDGRIAELGRAIFASADRLIDGAGLIALPGLVDLHTHLREPGFEQSETVLSGSRAAAIGGFTAVHAMANTSPVADTAGVPGRTRPLCDYPAWPKYKGAGDVNSAQSYACATQ